MSSVLDQFNLTPQERRVVVIIAIIVFIVLNMLLVWPHFSDLGKIRRELATTRNTIQAWNKEIINDGSATGYKAKLEKLQKQQGGGIGDKQVQLQSSIYEQARKTGVNLGEIRPIASLRPETNAFYLEESVRITFESEESQLVNFLFNIGNDAAMIRVRELSLKAADANRYRLKGDAILTANYQKKVVETPKAAKAPAATVPTVNSAGRPVPPSGPPASNGRPPRNSLKPRSAPGVQ